MKSKTLFINTIILAIVLSGCKKDSEDEFNNANGDVAEKLVKSVEVYNKDFPGENYSYTINYDGNNKVSSYTSGSSSCFFNYGPDGSLSSTTDEYETISMSELYQVPYDAFESGEVLEYDDKGNPILIQVWKDGFGSEFLNGEIIYDPNPNPYFYTLKAAGIIDVLDRIDLDFGYNVPAIVQARKLLFMNNPRSVIFKNNSGITEYEVHVTYTYDSEGYPTHAEMIAISNEGTDNYVTNYYYK